MGLSLLPRLVLAQMDRPALNGFEIVEQLEKEFGLQSYPINWCGMWQAAA